jgi:hypothetical protein
MTAEWIIDLQAEMRAMIRAAIEESPYGFIVAIEQEQDHEKGIADRGDYGQRSPDDSRT